MRSTGLALRRRLSFVVAESLGLIILADWLFPPGAGRGDEVPVSVPPTLAPASDLSSVEPFAAELLVSAAAPALGANVALFCVALVMAILLRGGAAWRTWPGRLLLVALGGLLLALLRDPGPLAIAMSVVGLAALAIMDRQGWSAAAALRAVALTSFAWDAIKRPFRDLGAVLRSRHARRAQAGVIWPAAALALRWILPLALAALFIGLFAIANPVIARWLSNLPALPAPDRSLLWLMVGLGAWGLLRGHARSSSNVEADPSPRPGALERFAGWDWITPSLILFNAIFAVQSTLDVLYLLGRAELPEGVTYAQYAHRGAYPLMITALLAGWFVLLTFRPGGLAERHALTRWLVQLWIAQNVLLTCSALWRLSMYVDVYSLTRLRVAAAIWMLLVAIGLVLLIARIASGRSNRWLLNATTWATACVLYACSFVAFSRFIADYNVARCGEFARPTDPALSTRRAPLDIAYLEALGPDALPALHRYVVAASDGFEATVAPGIDRTPAALAAIRRLERELDLELTDWRGWTLTRAALRRSRPMRALPATSTVVTSVPAR